MNDSVARVVECFGRRAIVQLDDARRLRAVVFGKRLEIVCGDRVRLADLPVSDEFQIVEVLPRSTTFSRTDSRGRIEHLAANLSLLAVVLAPEPEPDLFIVDRYLAGAAYAGLAAMVIMNKADLASEDRLEEYREAGYRTMAVSATRNLAMAELRECLARETFMLVGQSGVGKSSIANALVPESRRPTRELSEARGEGRHTTVSSALFDLPDGGALIDSPGVRDYAPPPLADDKVQVGWPELLARAPQCRFNNCLHLREPGCAVLSAVASGAISPRRYESYKRLLNLMRQLLPSYQRH